MQALEEVQKAMGIIESADQRALAVDGPVGHVRDMMTDREWRDMYVALERAKERLQRAVGGTGA